MEKRYETRSGDLFVRSFFALWTNHPYHQRTSIPSLQRVFITVLLNEGIQMMVLFCFDLALKVLAPAINITLHSHAYHACC